MDCVHCGEPLGDDGLCEVCLMAGGLEKTQPLPETIAADFSPAGSGGAPEQPESDAAFLNLDHFGNYTILRVLGEGGMGTVYLAEQTAPIQRKVALKVVKPGMDTGAILARFRYERQALAVMDHPNIARVYDAASSAKGRPYFVMEYIEGEPITAYCDRRRLSTAARLKLFIPVCQALQHAHSKGVLHRDIKPSNVMVKEVDGSPVPKVIDFGIAKAVDAGGAAAVMVTQFGQLVGTPEYMSPEAADVVNGDVDTTSDVYSLGVLLYELLVGAVPFDGNSLRAAGLLELLRIIRQEDPPPLPVRLRGLGETVTGIAARRSTTPVSLQKEVAGELNLITMKAVEKQRERRYESAQDLARDVERYLDNKPVEASPPSAAYQLRKFAQRHRAIVLSAAAVLAALFLGLGTTAWKAREAVREREIARRERSAAQQERAEAFKQKARAEAETRRANEQEATARENLRDVRDLANSMLFELDEQIKDLGGTMAARRTLVNLGLKYLRKAAPGDPHLGAAYFRIAELQGPEGLNDLENARENYRKSSELLTGNDAASRRMLAVAVMRQAQMEDSEARQNAGFLRAGGILRELLKDEPRNTEAMLDLARVLIAGNRPDEAAVAAETAIAAGAHRPASRAVLGEAQLAMVTWVQDRDTAIQALDWSARAVETLGSAVKDEPGNITFRIALAKAFDSLAKEQAADGDLGAAANSARRSLEVARDAAALDKENARAQLQFAASQLGLVRQARVEGNSEEARKYMGRGTAILQGQSEQHPRILELRLALARWLMAGSEWCAGGARGLVPGQDGNCDGNRDEVLAQLREAVAWLREATRLHPRSGTAKRLLHACLQAEGGMLVASREYPRAIASFSEALRGETALCGASRAPEDVDALAWATYGHGQSLANAGQVRQGIEQLEKAAALYRSLGRKALDSKRILGRFSRVLTALAARYAATAAMPRLFSAVSELRPVLEERVVRNPGDGTYNYALRDTLFHTHEYYRMKSDSANQLATNRRALALARAFAAIRPRQVERMVDVQSGMMNVAGALIAAGRRAEALAIIREALGSAPALFGPAVAVPLKLKFAGSTGFLVRFLNLLDEPAESAAHGLRLAEALEEVAVSDPMNLLASDLLETAYRDVAAAYQTEGNVEQALRYRESEMKVMLRDPARNSKDHLDRGALYLTMANYASRLGLTEKSRDRYHEALRELERAALLSEQSLSGAKSPNPVDSSLLYQSLQMRATIHEYQGDAEAARKASEMAVEQIDRLVAAQPSPANRTSQRAMRGRLLRLLSLRNAPREELMKWWGSPAPSGSQIEESIAEGWRATVANMSTHGYDVYARVPTADKAVEMTRALTELHPDDAHRLDLARALDVLANSYYFRARFLAPEQARADRARSRAGWQEAARIFEDLRARKALPPVYFGVLVNNRLRLASIDAKFPPPLN